MDYKIRAGWNHSKSVKFNLCGNSKKKLNYRNKNHLNKKKQGSLKTTFSANPAVQQAGHRREFISFFTS